MVRHTAALICVLLLPAGPALAVEPLESWRDTPTRVAIVDFVEGVTDPDGPDYVAPEDRIAVFDNDGNLWAEQPVYFQLLFALDRLRELAPQHPQWSVEQPYKAALEGDLETLGAAGEEGLLEIVMATHAGMGTEVFADAVSAWLASARHPRFEQPYTELTYLPMRELLDYLAENGFSNYIVSGGGVAFMRVWASEAYGIPPERIIGSRVALSYDGSDSAPQVLREARIAHINDKGGKPVGISQVIGKRPIFASGNSDGDFAMLQWTTAGDGPRFGLLLHHTDAEREWAYDRDSHVGRLDRALDAAGDAGWTVVDMARDWQKVFAFSP